MPAGYVIFKDRRLVFSWGWDRLTFGDFRSQQDAFIQDPDFDPSYDQLVDVSKATSLELSIEEAKTIARRRIFRPTSRRAVIATNPDVFGMGRMMDVHHSMSTGRDQVQVFYDRESALKWLGLDNLPVEFDQLPPAHNQKTSSSA